MWLWMLQELLKHYGAKNVKVIYRKDFEHMTATKVEINDAKEEKE